MTHFGIAHIVLSDYNCITCLDARISVPDSRAPVYEELTALSLAAITIVSTHRPGLSLTRILPSRPMHHFMSLLLPSLLLLYYYYLVPNSISNCVSKNTSHFLLLRKLG